MIEHTIEECQCEGKQCTKCKIVRCVGAFRREKRVKSGLTARCLICLREDGLAHYYKNHERVEEYRRSHVKELTAYKKAWARNNPEKVKLAQEDWKKRNPEKIKVSESKRRKVKYQVDPTRAIEHTRAYRRAHPDYNREYAQKNPEIIRTKTANRRARRKQAEGKYTVQEWEALKAKYDYTCLCCGKKEPEIKLTPDHIVPLVKKGVNRIENIQPLCLPCNSSKRTKTTDYRRKIL